MAFQGIFRLGNKMVVVKPIPLTKKVTLEVGTVIDMAEHHVRPFQLRLWFRRRRIGTKGSPWVEQMLAGTPRPETAQIKKAKSNGKSTKKIKEEKKKPWGK